MQKRELSSEIVLLESGICRLSDEFCESMTNERVRLLNAHGQEWP